MPPSASTHVLLISDATGSMGAHVLQAIFTQFPAGTFRLELLKFVNNEPVLEACLARLRRLKRALVVHATIYEDFKRRIEAVCRERGLPVYDLTGPIMRFVTHASGRAPVPNYQQLHALTPDYFERISAIEFAIAHDDGGGLGTLGDADVILTGVSRTTKTPTTMFIALAGWKAANVPLVHGLEPPRELLNADPSRVVCLAMRPELLSSVRSTRVETELGHGGEYENLQMVRREIVWSRQLAETRGWQVLDVTGRAVEETAARVLDVVRHGRSPAPTARGRRKTD